MLCEACGTPFEPKRSGGRFCSNRCRAKAWREQKDREMAAALDEAERALRKVRRALVRAEMQNN